MRAFLAKKNIASKFKQAVSRPAIVIRQSSNEEMRTEDAVVRIQTAFRGYRVCQLYGPMINQKTGKIDIATAKFIEPFAARWKKKSIFQILLQYRSVRHMDLVNLSQVWKQNRKLLGKKYSFNISFYKPFYSSGLAFKFQVSFRLNLILFIWLKLGMFTLWIYKMKDLKRFFINLQQVHIFNQRMVTGLTATSQCIILDKIDPKEINKEQLG